MTRRRKLTTPGFVDHGRGVGMRRDFHGRCYQILVDNSCGQTWRTHRSSKCEGCKLCLYYLRFMPIEVKP